ncbi:MAG: 3-oxoacyl-[acyl-carrier-protein] reductase [Chitinophagales bacterium]
MGLLTNKVALITGATRGIGRAMALQMAKEGANIAFTYRSSVEKATTLTEELHALGIKAVGYQSDASDFKAAQTLIKSVIKTFGRIDILVNNAGITRDGLLLRMKESQWDDVMNTNLKSVFNLTKNAVRYMMKQQAGSIINVSSVVGVRGNAGQANYSASKAGIIGFSKSVAQELGSRNVRCNVIAPGFVATDMTDELKEETKADFLKTIPLRRFGTGKEIADVAVFLASDMSSYVSGQVLSVCGGLSC